MMKKTKNSLTAVLTTIICLLPIILSCVLYDKLPERIAIHFNNAGEADTYLAKFLFVFGLPLILAVFNLLIHFKLNTDPNKANSSYIIKGIIKWCVPIVSVIGISFSVFISLGYNAPIHIIIPALAGIIIIICGNYLPKSRQNYTVGIKLPWTLNNADNWNKTQRLAGFLYIIGGFAIIVGSFFQMGGILTISVVLLLIAIPFIYSYVLFKRGL